MSQLILGVHSGSHDAAAALFDGYELKAAVSLERLTRNKGDGAYPDLAIDEVLSIAGVTRKDVDVVCHSRTLMPTKYFRNLSAFDRLKEQYRTYLRGKPRRQMMPEIFRHDSADAERFYDSAALLRDKGFRDGTQSFFYNHHEAHALPALFYCPDWDDALLVTADGGGDNVHYSHRHFANGALTEYLWRRGHDPDARGRRFARQDVRRRHQGARLPARAARGQGHRTRGHGHSRCARPSLRRNSPSTPTGASIRRCAATARSTPSCRRC